MKKSIIFSLVVIFLLVPATLFLGTRLSGRMYYLTSTLLVIETMLPFFLRFESRKPQARELVIVAVMCALAVAARIVVQIPDFKPMMAIIILSGIAFGAEAGFMTGAVSAFASNFFFSQGPWTPWQMLSYGLGGFLAGLLFSRRRPFPKKPMLCAALLAVFGFFVILGLVGPVLDSCTLFTTGGRISLKYALAVFAAGFPHNLIHAVTTAVTLLILSIPMLSKLDRLKTKYGLLEP